MSTTIRYHSIEADVKTLLLGWLKSWFDGASHTLSGTALDFPLAQVAPGVHPPVQPLNGVEICVVVHASLEGAYIAGGHRTVLQKARLDFIISANLGGASPGTDPQGPAVVGETRESLAQKTADRLYAILRHPDTALPLVAGGILNPRPRVADEIPNSQYAVRLLPCRCELRIDVPA